MRDAVGRAPAAHGRARGGEPAGGDRHRLTVGEGGSAMVVGDEDRPAAGGRRPCDGDVAAEVHENGGAGRAERRCGRAIGGERLRGRAEVDQDAGRDTHAATLVVDLDPLPAGGGDELDPGGLAAGDDDSESRRPSRGRASTRPRSGRLRRRWRPRRRRRRRVPGAAAGSPASTARRCRRAARPPSRRGSGCTPGRSRRARARARRSRRTTTPRRAS